MTDSKKEYLEFTVGPYLATTQMAYLYGEAATQAVHGPLDLLMFSKVPVILSYDDTYLEWTTDEILMQKLGITRDKLEELLILWTYPIEPLGKEKDLLVASENALSRARLKPSWVKLRALYKYPVIFDCDCVCRTIDKAQKMPKETTEVMGIKLPIKCYLYLLLGLVNSHLLSVVVSGKILDYSNLLKGTNLQAAGVNNKATMYQTVLHLLKASPMLKPYFESAAKFVYVTGAGSSIDVSPASETAKERKYTM